MLQLQIVQNEAVAVVGYAEAVRGLAIGSSSEVGADPGERGVEPVEVPAPVCRQKAGCRDSPRSTSKSLSKPATGHPFSKQARRRATGWLQRRCSVGKPPPGVRPGGAWCQRLGPGGGLVAWRGAWCGLEAILKGNERTNEQANQRTTFN